MEKESLVIISSGGYSASWYATRVVAASGPLSLLPRRLNLEAYQICHNSEEAQTGGYPYDRILRPQDGKHRFCPYGRYRADLSVYC
jgi:hypothetical protein